MKNPISYRIIFLLLTVSFSQMHVYSQVRTSQSDDVYYAENLELITDRVLYIAGEKIWFKVDCSDKGGNASTVLSRIVYLELYDQNATAVSKGKFRLTEGKATGFLEIPSSVITGYYYIRAYTQYLRNLPPYSCPSSLVTVINPGKPPSESETVSEDKLLVVPEGGKLLAGKASRVALRVDPALNKKIRKSVVTDNQGRELVQVQLYASGMAMFEFTPETGGQYFVKLSLDDGETIQELLPAVLTNGMALHAECKENSLRIELVAVALPGYEATDNYMIEIRSQAFENLLTRQIKPGGSVEIPVNQLVGGILYVSLTDSNNEVIDISPVYVPVETGRDIQINKSKEVYARRELVDLDISFPEKPAGKNNYMISVTKKGTGNESGNLLPASLTYNPALLSNYLNTAVMHPDSLKDQVDIALILQAAFFRQTAFRESIKHENTLWLPETRDISISGKVIDSRTKGPLKDIMVYASVLSGSNQVHISKTNPEGEFYFTLNHLTGKQPVYICTKPVDSLQVDILINNDFSNYYPAADFIPLEIDTSDRELIEQLYLNSQLNKAFLVHATKTVDNISYYPLLKKDQEIRVYLKDFIEIPVLSEIFDEIVPFVSTRKKKDQYYLGVFDDKNMQEYTDPLVLLDGMPVFDMNKIMRISPELVDTIGVTNRLCYLGDYSMGGIINIITHTKNFAGISFPEESVFMEYETVSPESYPVFPDHALSLANDRNPDFRNLLYWNPYLSAENGKAKISFYTSDDAGDYEVIIRGEDAGTRYSGRTMIRVE